MARQLWLLRHADAEPHGTRPDPERRLTERGEHQARAAGRALGRMGVAFQAALTSPKERALRTATLALGVWGEGTPEAPPPPELEVHTPLGGGFDHSDALAALAAFGTGGRLLVVGHEPDLSGVVATLTGARIDLKKGGLAVLRLSPAAGTHHINGSLPGGEKGSLPQGEKGSLQEGETPEDYSSAGAAGELVLLLRPAELALVACLAVAEL
jgi:phosphohistidine phosphatase